VCTALGWDGMGCGGIGKFKLWREDRLSEFVCAGWMDRPFPTPPSE